MRSRPDSPLVTASENNMIRKVPKQPPRKLKERGKRFWKLVMVEFELSDSDQVVLVSACEMLDRAEAARKLIEKDGMTIKDRFGQTKPHPCVEVERQSHLAFVRIRRELGLDVEPPDSRPATYPRGYR